MEHPERKNTQTLLSVFPVMQLSLSTLPVNSSLMLFQEHVMKQCNKIIKNEIILMQVSPLMRRDFAMEES